MDKVFQYPATGFWRIIHYGDVAELICPEGHLGILKEEFTIGKTGVGIRNCLVCKIELPENIATQFILMTT